MTYTLLHDWAQAETLLRRWADLRPRLRTAAGSMDDRDTLAALTEDTAEWLEGEEHAK